MVYEQNSCSCGVSLVPVRTRGIKATTNKEHTQREGTPQTIRHLQATTVLLLSVLTDITFRCLTQRFQVRKKKLTRSFAATIWGKRRASRIPNGKHKKEIAASTENHTVSNIVLSWTKNPMLIRAQQSAQCLALCRYVAASGMSRLCSEQLKSSKYCLRQVRAGDIRGPDESESLES